MAEVIRMPKMSDTMIEGVIASWLVKVGDQVKSGDILAEVETDKATMELDNYTDGTILYIAVPEKGAVPINGVIAVVGQPGEDYQALLAGEGAPAAAAPAPAAPAAAAPAPAPAAPAAPAVDLSGIPATVIRMPKMSDTMKEGVIASWLVKVGDQVKSGDILAEVETDKATMELDNYTDGTVLYIGVEAGKSVAIDGVIAIIGEPGTDYKPLLAAEAAAPAAAAEAPAAAPAAAPAPVAAPAAAAAPVAAAPAAAVSRQAAPAPATDGQRVFASPLAKKMAEEKGFNIAMIPGSGEHGRIVKRDVESFVPQPTAAAVAAAAPAAVALGVEQYTEEPLSQMRKTIARRLSESLFTAPHFYLTMEIDMDKAIAARGSMNEVSDVKISFNDLVIKAVSVALKKHPYVNASWQESSSTLRFNQHVNIGVAVAVPEGLLVPVVRFADQKSLSQISSEVKDLGKRAKDKKLQPADWEGSTFTISNLGMFGIDEFTAIINQPNACILAVGGIRQTPVVKNGQIVPGNLMKVTLSCDHRVVDGAVGAAFLKTLKELIEEPYRLLV